MAENNPSQQSIGDKITKWFHDEGYVVEPAANDKSYYYANVYFVTPSGHRTSRIFVDIPKNSRDKINVGTRIDYELLEKPSNSSGDNNVANTYNAAFTDALFPLNIAFNIDLTVERIKVEILKTIYFDGLSKHVLFDIKSDVLAAYNTITLVHKRLLKKYDG
jgi:hypothetical protein